MKPLSAIGLILLISLALIFISFGDKQVTETSELELIQEMSYTNDSHDKVNWAEQTYQTKFFTLYINELKDTHLELTTSRETVITEIEELKLLKLYLIENNIELTEDDQLIIKESYLKLRLYRFILEETNNEGYQQLLILRENKELYSREQAKDILIDVYLVLNSRINIYNDIYEELSNIKVILEQY